MDGTPGENILWSLFLVTVVWLPCCANIRMSLVGLNSFSLLMTRPLASFSFQCFICKIFPKGMSHTLVFRNFLLKTVVIGSILISLLVWPLMIMSHYQYGLTTITMKKWSLHMSDSTGQDGEVSDIFWTILESSYSPVHMQIFHCFRVCSDWLYSAITYSPITTSLSGQIRLKSIVTLIAVEHFKYKKIPYPTEAEMVGHSKFIHKILCAVAVWLPGKGWRNPEDSHYSHPLGMIRIFLAQLLPKRIWSAKESILCRGEAGVNQMQPVQFQGQFICPWTA